MRERETEGSTGRFNQNRSLKKIHLAALETGEDMPIAKSTHLTLQTPVEFQVEVYSMHDADADAVMLMHHY
jgi:hypothetical protein